MTILFLLKKPSIRLCLDIRARSCVDEMRGRQLYNGDCSIVGLGELPATGNGALDELVESSVLQAEI